MAIEPPRPWQTRARVLTGPDGRPGVTLEPGERFRVDLANEAGTERRVLTEHQRHSC
jgi:hypothetical protein